MDLMLSARNFFEIAYFISGPVISIGVIIALFQYFQYKKDVINKYEREIADSTIKNIHNFQIKLEPSYDRYIESLNLTKEYVGFSFKGKYENLRDNNLFNASNQFFNSISEESRNKSVEVAYEMNKFALSFTFLLSDDTKAQQIIGKRYIQIFDSILFILSYLSVTSVRLIPADFQLFII